MMQLSSFSSDQILSSLLFFELLLPEKLSYCFWLEGVHRCDGTWLWSCENPLRRASRFYETAQLLYYRRLQRVLATFSSYFLSLLLRLTCLFVCLWHRHSLQYFTTHTDLVKRQKEAIEQRKTERGGLKSDKDWTGDGFVKETESMVSN